MIIINIIIINNNNALQLQSMKATKGFSVSEWCRNFEITFQGEQGKDTGCLLKIVCT